MKILLKAVDKGLAWLENTLIVSIVLIMVLMSFMQVVLRNIFETGILWGDIFLRHLVLWVGFIGASLATREGKHINIEILTRLVPQKVIPYIKIFIDSVSLVICILLAKAGYVFLSFEIEMNTILFENIPAWYFQLIIPVGFGLIGFRFLIKIVERIMILRTGS